MKWLILVSIFIFSKTIINAGALALDKDDTTQTAHHSVNKRSIDPYRPQLIRSLHNMHEHVLWGMKTDPKPSDTGYYSPFYTAYGPCKSEKNITYEQIANYTEAMMILSAYKEIFGVACVPDFNTVIDTLFSIGYIQKGPGNSLIHSHTAGLFFQKELSVSKMEEVQAMMELTAFSQVYVSWHKFPMLPVNPNGKRIPRRCFIETVYRLHALDLTARSAYWMVTQLAAFMAHRFEPIMDQMQIEFATHNGSGRVLHEKKKCLVVSQILYEYLIQETKNLKKAHSTCAHDRFKAYFKKRENFFFIKVDNHNKSGTIYPKNTSTSSC